MRRREIKNLGSLVVALIGLLILTYYAAADAASRLFFLAEFGRHQSVAHAYDEYVLGEAHVNTIENAWSLFKRGLVGMYHHVSAKYLQEYLDEFAFRYSHRHEKAQLMDLVLASCSCQTPTYSRA